MKKQKRKVGFTIIEMVTVVAIMAILFTVVTVSLRSKSKTKELDENVKAMKAGISLARNNALSGYQATASIIYGYGIYAASSSPLYIIYADTNNNQIYDSSVDTITENYALNDNAQITSCTGGGCDVFFSLYEGNVYANGATGFTAFTLNLQHPKDAGVFASITVGELTGAIE